MEVSASGYYAFVRRGGDDLRHADLIQRIREVHRRSRFGYGSRRIKKQLNKDGVTIGRYRVRRLMRLAGVSAKSNRRRKITTHSNHKYPASPNLIQGCFRTDAPNNVWVSDITYIKTSEGWLYLAAVMDLYSRRIVGWSLARAMTVDLVKNALLMAIGRRTPKKGLIHHSDRGIQYACDAYRQLLKQHQIVSSMSRSGKCLDNAVAERFFCTLKMECLANWKEMTADAVKADVVDYIEMFYNSERLHSYDGYCSPKEYEERTVTLL